MNDYLEDIVQRIVTKCDLTDFNILKGELDGLEKKANRISKAFSSSLTGEQQIQLAQENSALAWNNALREKSRETVSWNNALKARENRLREESISQQKIATQETDKYLAKKRLENTIQNQVNTANRRDMQLSKERVAQLKAETTATHRRNTLLRTGIRLIGTYFGIRTIQNIINTGARLQMLQQSIKGLTGSGQDWEFITQQAYKYGVSLDTVATGYRNFFSSARMAGFSTKQIQGMYGDLLLSTRAIGASSEQTGGALLALEQMISKGVVSMEELRRQLGNSIPGAFEIGAKAMNMTTQQFNEFVKSGKLASVDFVPRFIKTLKEQYANGWKDVEQTVAVAQGRLLVSWQEFTQQFVHGEAGKELARAINALAKFVVSPEFLELIQILSTIVKWGSKIFVLIMRILDFAIKHITTLLVLLGTAGLMGKFGGLNVALSIMLKKVKLLGSAFLNFIKIAWAGLGGLKGVIGTLGRAIFINLLPLFAAEDIILGLGQYFLGWNVRSLLGDFLVAQKQLKEIQKDAMGIGNLKAPQAYAQNLTKDPIKQKQFLNAMKSGDVKKQQQVFNETWGNYSYTPADARLNKRGIMADIPLLTGQAVNIDYTGKPIYIPPTTPQIIPTQAGYVGTLPSLGDINKEQQNQTTVTIGDINVYSNASNPTQVAEEVQNQLISLFLGQGLTMSLEGVTA